MSFQVRIADIDSDSELEGIASIVSQFEQEPSTPEDIRRIFTHPPPGRITCRLVAIDEGGRVIGYSCAVHEAFSPKGVFYAWVGVDAGSRRQGAGQALQQQLWSFLDDHKAELLYSEVHDNDPVSLEYAKGKGFHVERHLFHSHLDLESFDEIPYAGLIEKLNGQGIRFSTLADEGDSPAACRKFYEIDKSTTEDIPGYMGPFMEFEEYEKRSFNPETYQPEGRLVAADGELYVGFATVTLVPGSGNAHNEMTGVRREYRGRGIALALKILAIRYAQAGGARVITTSNDSLNVPMLGINRKLGYLPETGIYWLKNDHPVYHG